MRIFTFAVIVCVLVVILILGAFTLNVLGASYEFKFPVTVVDTSNTTRYYYPVVLGFTGTTLQNAGKINASGNDTNIQEADENREFTIGTTHITTVLPELPAGGAVTADLYTGYSPEWSTQKMAWGEGGYVTVSDNANLEPIVYDWEIDWYGYVDTSTTGVIFNKPESCNLTVSNVGEITFHSTNPLSTDLVATGIDAGLIHIEVVFVNSFWCRLYIDGSVKDQETDREIIDTASDWILCSDITPYTENITFTINAVDVLHYQPTEIISGTVLPDRQGNDNPGVITWGSNTYCSIVYGEMEAYESMELDTSDVGFDMPESTIPATWFSDCENAANLPFYAFVNDAATNSGVPVCTIYFIITIGIAFAACLLVVMGTRSALMGVIAMTIVLFVGSSMTIVPMWIPFCVVVVDFGILYLYRQVAY